MHVKWKSLLSFSYLCGLLGALIYWPFSYEFSNSNKSKLYNTVDVYSVKYKTQFDDQRPYKKGGGSLIIPYNQLYRHPPLKATQKGLCENRGRKNLGGREREEKHIIGTQGMALCHCLAKQSTSWSLFMRTWAKYICSFWSIMSATSVLHGGSLPPLAYLVAVAQNSPSTEKPGNTKCKASPNLVYRAIVWATLAYWNPIGPMKHLMIEWSIELNNPSIEVGTRLM